MKLLKHQEKQCQNPKNYLPSLQSKFIDLNQKNKKNSKCVPKHFLKYCALLDWEIVLSCLIKMLSNRHVSVILLKIARLKMAVRTNRSAVQAYLELHLLAFLWAFEN